MRPRTLFTEPYTCTHARERDIASHTQSCVFLPVCSRTHDCTHTHAPARRANSGSWDTAWRSACRPGVCGGLQGWLEKRYRMHWRLQTGGMMAGVNDVPRAERRVTAWVQESRSICLTASRRELTTCLKQLAQFLHPMATANTLTRLPPPPRPPAHLCVPGHVLPAARHHHTPQAAVAGGGGSAPQSQEALHDVGGLKGGHQTGG